MNATKNDDSQSAMGLGPEYGSDARVCETRVCETRNAATAPAHAIAGLGGQPHVQAFEGGSAMAATASANANIALIKYWGKADERLIIPKASSLSLTLEGLSTRTSVRFSGTGVHDALTIDGKPQSGRALTRVSKFLDIVRNMAGLNPQVTAEVDSTNTVPYGAGLASSASAFAALAAAASHAAGLNLAPRELSRLARRGSGSACRSVFGDLVLWHAGSGDETSYAEPVDCSKLSLAVVVVTVSGAAKPISSREAMRCTVDTSPLYEAWIQSCKDDLREALAAVQAGDIERLGQVTEANALGMHATIMAARPPIIYWMPQSVAVLHAVEDMRAAGFGAWSTMDAGPNVKVLCEARDANTVANELRGRLPGSNVSVHLSGDGVRFEC